MSQFNLMALRAYTPAGIAFGVAILLTWVMAGVGQSPITAVFFSPAKWVSLAALGFGFLQGVWTTYRLWRADRGEGLLCDCGGLLGAEIDGRYGPYRKCLACRRNVARRHYEGME